MTRNLMLGALIIAAGGILFWQYPKLTAKLDSNQIAYQKAEVLQGDRIQASDNNQYDGLGVATFAGGCFWCVESSLEKVPGVISAVSGYSGGDLPNPTYQQIASKKTGHTEAVQIYYDPQKISYEGLLQAFWRAMDPTDNDGQFSDRGNPYRPVIFYHSKEQQEFAQLSKAALDKSMRFPDPVIIPIEPYKNFYKAEDYHQDFSRKNPVHYKYYTNGSGRGPFVRRIWGKDLKLDYSEFIPRMADASRSMKKAPESSKPEESTKVEFKKPNDAKLKKSLTPMQYDVTQHEGTEPPFKNEYWDEKRDGIYVDIVSGEPLFSSKDKFKSGTGWPSFTRPLVKSNIAEKIDRKLFSTRIEVRSKNADSHLGHVFDDGPKPTGLRYCINSASLRFIPAHKLTAEGYDEFADQFNPAQTN